MNVEPVPSLFPTSQPGEPAGTLMAEPIPMASAVVGVVVTTTPVDVQGMERAKWTVAEADVPQKVIAHDGPVLVDLDETLLLRNSTEVFISLAAPGLVAAFLLRLLDMARPWRFIGGQACRDNWRILLVLALFPWTYARWLNYCRQTVPTMVNAPLRDALLQQQNPVVIASNGYELLIRPMLPFLGLPSAALVCCRLFKLRHRRDGKLSLVQGRYPDAYIAKCMTVTDSYTDAALMRVTREACLTVWHEARFERAFDGRIYLPGDYLSRIKRPRQGALRSLVQYDLIPWVLVGLSMSPGIPQFFGLVALFFSMWAVYEIGYYDNDRCAHRYEDDPKLTSEAVAFNSRPFEHKAWFMAIVLGAVGVVLMHPDNLLLMGTAWMTVLLALYGTYRVYNRVDKTSRIWLYAALQMFRFGSVFVIAVAGPVAVAAASAQMIARWIDYIIYRYQRSSGVTSWPKTANQTIRMTIFIMLVAPLLLTRHWQAFATTASLCFLVFGYGLLRYEWRAHAASFKRLDRAPAKTLLAVPGEADKPGA